MYVQIVTHNGFAHVFTKQIVVNKRFGCLAGKLHHHSCRRIGIHVCVFTGNIIRLDIDNLQENISCLCLTGYTALIPVSNIFLCHVFSATLHQFHFHGILNSLNGHLCISIKRDTVGNLMYQSEVFSFFCMQHCLTDSSGYFLFVKAHNSSVTLDYCLYHFLLFF